MNGSLFDFLENVPTNFEAEEEIWIQRTLAKTQDILSSVVCDERCIKLIVHQMTMKGFDMQILHDITWNFFQISRERSLR